MTEERYQITLQVNGVPHTATVPARRLLHDALRHDLGLTGTHAGCEHGVCGCCTVLLDGLPVRSCLMFAVGAQGADIRTVEGLAGPDGALHPIQRAFAECHGLQCGFCTPGFLMTTAGLLERNPSPSEAEITESMAGNLCRCTGYQNITRSVRRAAELLAAGEGGDPQGPWAGEDPEEPVESSPLPGGPYEPMPGGGVPGERD
jgi:carbon-monoxide dehydrogenase small subunit